MTALSAIYELLFGRTNLDNGTVIDLAEHGRNGGIQTGQGFKFVQITPLSVRTNTSNGSLTIYGFANPGVNASEPSWRVMGQDTSGNIFWANGSIEFTNTFINPGTLPFS